jgi:hypothetical protein
MYFNKKDFNQVAYDFEKAVGWLSKLGLNYAPRRIGGYRKYIKALAQAYETNSLEELLEKESVEDLENSLREASQIVLIYRGLSKFSDPGLTADIKKFTAGPAYEKDEKPNHKNHQPRDTEFELSLAAYFSASGFDLDLRSKAESKADLSILDGTTRLFLECKRPTSAESVEGNVHKALKQLTKRYNASEDATVRGLAALSITKIINPKQKRFVVKSPNHLSRQLVLLTKQFIRNHSRCWRTNLDIRTLGVLVYFQTAVEIQSEGLLTVCRQITIDNITLTHPLEQRRDDLYVNDIGNRLNRGLNALRTKPSV